MNSKTECYQKNNTPYTCKQPLMMAYEGPKSAQENFGKFIHQFQPKTKTLITKLENILIKLYRQNFGKFIHQIQPETKTLIRKPEKILIKLYRRNLSLLFNGTCLYIYILSSTDRLFCCITTLQCG